MALKWSGRWLLGRVCQRQHPLAPHFAVYPRRGISMAATSAGTLHRSRPLPHNLTSPTGRCLSTSARCSSLMDFFDDKKNWDKEEFHGDYRSDFLPSFQSMCQSINQSNYL